MRFWKLLLGVAALGLVAVAFRDVAGDRWLRPASPFGGEDDEDEDRVAVEEEPVLGYDGMDRDTLVDWLSDADLDHETLLAIHAYESANLNRGPVLDTIDDLLA